MKYWIGPYIYGTVGQITGWYWPVGAVGAIDLRSVPQQIELAPTGFGLFVTEDITTLDSEYTLLGSGGPDLIVASEARLLYESALKVSLEVDRLDLILAHTLIHQSDPTGENRVKTLIPGRNLWHTIHLGGQVIYRNKFDPLDAAVREPVLETLRGEYQAIYDDNRKSEDLHREVLGMWVKEYQLPYEMFQPAGVPDDTPILPGTTFIEDFDTADSATLGPNLTWAEVEGDAKVANNEYRTTAATVSRVRAEHDVASANHHVQASVKFVGGSGALDIVGGVCARHHTSAATFYLLHAHWHPQEELSLFKCVAGSFTLLDTKSITPTPNTFETIKLTCVGSTISGEHKGVLELSVTDSSIAGNTRGGMRNLHGEGDNSTIYIAADDWTISDGLMGEVTTIIDGAEGEPAEAGEVSVVTAAQTARTAWAILKVCGAIGGTIPAKGEVPTEITIGSNRHTNPNLPSQDVLRALAREAAAEDNLVAVETEILRVLGLS
jgi:hypothetical protein